jgi:hypothetical protein
MSWQVYATFSNRQNHKMPAKKKKSRIFTCAINNHSFEAKEDFAIPSNVNLVTTHESNRVCGKHRKQMIDLVCEMVIILVIY